MKMPNLLKGMAGALAALSTVLVLGGAASAAEWPTKPVTIIVPFSPGGSVDRMARSLATYMTKEVGTPISVVNRPGAAGQLGATVYLNMPDDGSTLMASVPVPYLVNNIQATDAPYTLDDFQQVNAQWIATGSFMINKDAPYKSMDDLIDTIINKPGEVSAGVIGQSAEHITLLALLKELGVPKSNVRLVTFDGGGPTRTAVAGGQVDFAVLTAQGSESILDNVQVVAMNSDEAVSGWDYPLINDALAPHGVEVPILQSSVRGILVQHSFVEKHPEVYEAFMDAYQRTLNRDDYKEFAEQNNIGIVWRGPEHSDKIVRNSFELTKKHSSLLDEE